MPDPGSCLAIEQWCGQNWPTLLRPVRARNYHLTLSFLGDITPQQLERMEEQLQSYSAPVIDISLDDTGFWPNNGILWLGSRAASPELTELAGFCTRVANRAGIKVSKKPYHAHLTLARNLTLPPPPPLVEPEFQLQCDRLLLLQSLFDKSGVRYVDIMSW